MRKIILVMLMLTLTGCIDFRNKALVLETKVVGLDASVPSFDGTELACVKLGFITTRYLSAPEGGEASVKNTYTDISILTLSGSGVSELTVKNALKNQTK